MSDIIGYLIWYSISGGANEEPLDVTRDQMRAWLNEVGIDAAYLPSGGRAIDAFRSASTNLTDTYDADGVTVTLVVREVEQTADYVTRNVVRTWTEADGKAKERRLAYMQFFRPRRSASGRIQGSERLRMLVDRRLKGVDRVRADALVARCQELYTANRQRLNAHAVRSVVRSYLTGIGAVAVEKSTGGWYLMPPEGHAQLVAVTQLVRRCGPDCRMLLIPMADLPELREMIVDSVDADVAGRAQFIVREMVEWTEANHTGAPTLVRWSAWRADCQILQDLLVSYVNRYDATFPAAATALDQAVDLTEQLGRRIAAAGKDA